AQRAVCSQSFLFDSGHDLVDAHAEIIVEHKHLAARDEAIIHEHVHGIAGEFVQLDDGSLIELQHVLHHHACAAKLDLHIHLDVAQKIDAGNLRIAHNLLEIGKL